MTSRLLTTFLLAALVSTAGPASADVVSLTSSRDNTLYETFDGSLSSGSGPTMFVGRTAQGFLDRRRALVAFDLTSIPAGSTILGVELKLFMSQTISGTQTVTIHKASASWGEGTSDAGLNGGAGALSTPGDATWLHRFHDSQFWSNPGGDFSGTPSASAPVTGFAIITWGSTAAMVSDVQGWLDNPATNFGWLIRGNEDAPATAKKFNTRENASTTTRPTLVVTFNPPAIPVVDTSWSRIKALYGDVR